MFFSEHIEIHSFLCYCEDRNWAGRKTQVLPNRRGDSPPFILSNDLRELYLRRFTPNERRSIFAKLFFFAKRCNISYKTFIFEKQQFNDEMKLEGKIAREISLFIKDNLLFFQSFDEVVL